MGLEQVPEGRHRRVEGARPVGIPGLHRPDDLQAGPGEQARRHPVPCGSARDQSLGGVPVAAEAEGEPLGHRPAQLRHGPGRVRRGRTGALGGDDSRQPGEAPDQGRGEAEMGGRRLS